ncbi:MAG: YceI family protein [Dehalococcoidia bacterium]
MLMRRAIFTCAGALIVLIVATVAGWWFFVREDNELATNPPDIPDELVQPTESAPTASAGNDVLTFRIVPAQSEAAYFVDEELASIGLPSTAKGTTQEVEGEFHLTPDGTALAPNAGSSFTVDLRNLASDESRRDGRVQEALETATYPTAAFAITSVTGYDPGIAEGEEQTLMLTGTLDLHGIQKDVTWEVKARRESNVISALATLVVPFADFNITAPTFAGLVSIDDQATLQVQLVAELV